jgi:DNA-binding transcriptional LysR family regulator
MGVATLPGLALEAHRAAGVHATEIPGDTRQSYAATYGEPPDPPATTALIDILTSLSR